MARRYSTLRAVFMAGGAVLGGAGCGSGGPAYDPCDCQALYAFWLSQARQARDACLSSAGAPTVCDQQYNAFVRAAETQRDNCQRDCR